MSDQALIDRIVADLQSGHEAPIDPDATMTTHDASGDVDDLFTIREIVDTVLRHLR